MINIDGIEITPLLDTLKLQKISDEIYFSEPYRGYVSNSRLSLLFDNEGNPTPDKFFEGFKSGFNQSFVSGSRVHELILQPDLFELIEIPEKPSAKLGAVADKLYPIYKKTQTDPIKEQIIEACKEIDYYSKSLTDNKINTILESSRSYWQKRFEYESNYTGEKTLQFEDSKTCETVFGCVNAVKSNKYHQDLLHPKGLIENNELGEKSKKIFFFLWKNKLIPTKENIEIGLKKLNIDIKDLDNLYKNINNLMQQQLNYEKKNK